MYILGASKHLPKILAEKSLNEETQDVKLSTYRRKSCLENNHVQNFNNQTCPILESVRLFFQSILRPVQLLESVRLLERFTIITEFTVFRNAQILLRFCSNK